MVDCLDNPCHKIISAGRYVLHEQSGKRTRRPIHQKQYFVLADTSSTLLQEDSTHNLCMELIKKY